MKQDSELSERDFSLLVPGYKRIYSSPAKLPVKQIEVDAASLVKRKLHMPSHVEEPKKTVMYFSPTKTLRPADSATNTTFSLPSPKSPSHFSKPQQSFAASHKPTATFYFTEDEQEAAKRAKLRSKKEIQRKINEMKETIREMEETVQRL